MYKKIKEAGKAVSDRYSGSMNYFYLTPASLSLLKPLLPVFEKYVKGDLLDLGAGRLSYRFILKRFSRSYRSIDIDTRSCEVDALGDVQQLPIKDEVFDSVFCTQVLEHIPEPQKAIDEIYRILKKGGHAIFTVPHLAYLHNEPHDYFRYTRHGLKFILEKKGFQVEQISPAGGLVSFLGHIPSTILINVFSGIPLINRVLFMLNKFYVKMIVSVDQLIEKKKLFALNYIAVVSKPK